MFSIHYTGQFKRDLKRIKKRSEHQLATLQNVAATIAEKGVDGVPAKHRPHILSGKLADHWECHVLPDLLLIWLQNDTTRQITFVRAGSHSDLF